MFYRTQIKSVTDFGVVDMAGKKLRFVGYLPVKAGDWVFTDGTFIFGNVPPRGSPATFGEDPAGIPVLGDKYLNDEDSDEKELRGYFSNQGKYKKYKIAGNEWIVNSDKKFFHDDGEENIIDAEISDEDKHKLLTLEKKIQGNGNPGDGVFDQFYSEEGIVSRYDANIGGYVFESATAYNGSATLKDSDFCSDDDTISRDLTLIIKSDGETIQRIDVYNEYIQYYEESEKARIDKLLKDGLISYTDHSSAATSGKIITETDLEPLEWNYGTRAQVAEAKIHPDGSWFITLIIVIVHRQKIYSEHFKVEYPVYHTRIVFVDRGSYGNGPELYNSVTSFWLEPGVFIGEQAGSKWGSASQRTVTKKFQTPMQDGFRAEIKLAETPPDNIWWKWTLGKIYDANKEVVADFSDKETADAHTWNMSIIELKGNEFLFGIHDHELYKIDKDKNVEQVGDGLKNFRLRELKKISKSKT